MCVLTLSQMFPTIFKFKEKCNFIQGNYVLSPVAYFQGKTTDSIKQVNTSQRVRKEAGKHEKCNINTVL